MLELGYLTDRNGQPQAVVVPIALWRQLFPEGDGSVDKELPEEMEDYCLSKAMDKAQESPLLSRQKALAYLEE